MLKLYYAAHTCALATHIVLEEVGAAYSTVRINFGRGEQRSPEYLKVNPKGRVPALVTDRGILTETPAMLVFVAQSFPEAKLAPMDDAFAFAEIQAFNSYLCSSPHVNHAHRMRGHRWVDADDAHSSFPDSSTALFQKSSERRAPAPLRREPSPRSERSDTRPEESSAGSGWTRIERVRRKRVRFSVVARG